ncbi:MAG: hypothetical protein V7746_25865 [Halioglobus sp.]
MDANEKTIKKKSQVQELIEFLRKPTTIVWTVFIGVSTFFAEYYGSRALDILNPYEPPEELVSLNSNLQSSVGSLSSGIAGLEELVSKIEASAIEDPEVQSQLGEVSEKLASLGAVIKQTASDTEKLAVLSQTLQEGFERYDLVNQGLVQGVPNLLLVAGQSVQLCNAIVNFGVREIEDDGDVRLNISGKPRRATAGKRIDIGKDGEYVDYLGAKGNQATFVLSCDGLS